MGRVGTVREFGMDRYTRLCLRCITNKELLYSTSNCSVLRGSLDERTFKRERMLVYLWLGPLTVHRKLSQHC